MKNKSYIGITFIILIFGIFAVPKIIDRISNDKVLDGSRLNTVKRGVKTTERGSELIRFGKVPDFKFINQDFVVNGIKGFREANEYCMCNIAMV